MKRAANSFVPERQRFTLMSIRSGTVTGPKKVLIRLLGLSALLVLALAPLTTSADRVSIQILDPVRNDPDTPPGAGTIVDEFLMNADGPVAPLSFDGDIFNSPASMLDCCAGALAGSGRVVAEVDLSTSTVRAGAALSLNDPAQSGRRGRPYNARASAEFSQDYQVSSSNPAPPATTDILVTGIISGAMLTPDFPLDWGSMSAFVFASDQFVAGVTCVVQTQIYGGPQNANCDEYAPDVVIVQDGIDPLLWHVSGTFSETVQVPVNQVSRFGAFLSVLVLVSIETQAASDFSDSLVLSLTSMDPDITVTPVPEPARALQIVAALVTLAVVGSARRAGRRI
jgi:hypothetical protein